MLASICVLWVEIAGSLRCKGRESISKAFGQHSIRIVSKFYIPEFRMLFDVVHESDMTTAGIRH